MDLLDLTRHAVVEASAGTGKTYAIEQIVLRLLSEGHASLEQILVVTFTEKATAELKKRLRVMLEKAAAEQPRLLADLDRFDQAPIFTIHGFCQRLLSEYPLEHGQDFGPTLLRDDDLIEPALREVQRRVWRQAFGVDLPRVLEAAGYCYDQAGRWESQVRQLVGRYRPECGHQLRPELREGWPEADLAQAELPEDFGQQLQIFTVGRVREEMAALKKNRGLHSFDDMIARVAHGLDAAHNPGAALLLAALRRRFRYAIVDEFQDTDPLQWLIFRRIFVEHSWGDVMGTGTGRVLKESKFLEIGPEPVPISSPHECKLFVVGDPKQAIFAFRGADLPTYQAATRAMVGEFSAQTIPLAVNWRSCPELLTALNGLFRHVLPPEWFEYHDVDAPPPEERRTNILEDRTGRAALTLVDLRTQAAIARRPDEVEAPGKPPKASVARREFGWFAAREIRRLLAPGALCFTRQKEATALQPGDICILVFKRAEAIPLTKALRAHGIPFTFYKQPGLWQSAEAKQLRLLVHSLADSEDHSSWHKLLLTPLFAIDPEELAGEALPPSHPAVRLRQQWTLWAERRQWAALFQSVVEDTGVMVRGRKEPQHERSLANYRHLANFLAQAAYRDNLDVHGLADLTRNYSERVDMNDGDVQPIETDRAKVQIMTVHASKGLEFPVVFLAGGFTHRDQDPCASYPDEEGRKVWDLDRDGAKEKRKADLACEQRRLLYVALTRAMCKLYLPWVGKTAHWPGPVCDQLAPLLDQAGLEALGPPICQLSGLRSNEEKSSTDFTDSTDFRKSVESVKSVDDSSVDQPSPTPASYLLAPLPADLTQRRVIMQSFSSLHRRAAWRSEEGSRFGDSQPRRDDDVPDALAQEDPLRGVHFGQLVHDYLEELDFAEVGQAAAYTDLLRADAPARRLLNEKLAIYVPTWPTRVPRAQLESAAADLVARLAWNALHTRLPLVNAPLHALPTRDRLQEVEFHFPIVAAEPAAPARAALPGAPAARARAVPPEIQVGEGFLTGFMDLVFRHQDRYYLLDWKTNLLEGYGPEELARAMGDSDYHRQYRLYMQALRRWLTLLHGPPDRFLERFGGVFYLFLRGMTPPDGTGGVFVHRPNAEDLDLRAVLN